MKIRSSIFIALCALFCLLLVAYNAPALAGARRGFLLWRDQVLPALLPFFICTHILQHCGALSPGSRPALYFLSMVSGAPAGARLAGSLPGEQSAAIAALNTVSPMFIYSSFATGMLGNPRVALPILLAQFISAGLFFWRSAPLPAPAEGDPAPSFPFLQLLGQAIAASMGALVNIGGAIMFFMAFSSLLAETGLLATLTAPFAALCAAIGLSPQLPGLLMAGMLEMVSGCNALAQAGLPLRQATALGAFFFSFGGLCILAQSLSFAKLRPGPYLGRKLLQGCISALLAYLFFPLFLPDAQAVFAPSQGSVLLENAFSAACIGGISALCSSVILLLAAAAGRSKGTS